MKAFELEEVISAPRSAVFDAISDLTGSHEFLPGIVSSVKLTDGPIGVGTVFRETREIRGKQSSADLTVTEYHRDQTFGIGVEAEGITVAYRYQLAKDPGGTRVTWVCELEAGGLRKMMLPLVAGIMKKEDGDHLARLKAHLEGTGGAQP